MRPFIECAARARDKQNSGETAAATFQIDAAVPANIDQSGKVGTWFRSSREVYEEQRENGRKESGCAIFHLHSEGHGKNALLGIGPKYQGIQDVLITVELRLLRVQPLKLLGRF